MIDPKRFHAFVVGIESYAGGPTWNLKGPARDALEFASWLVARGVPPANINALLSPLPGTDPFDAFPDLRDKIAVHPATAASINAALDGLSKTKPAHFCMYWGGHGYVRHGDEHVLQCQDAHANNIVSVDLRNVLRFLSSDALGTKTRPGLRRSMIVVDACASVAELRGFDRRMTTPQSLPPGVPEPRPQCLLFATDNGHYAKNLSAEGTGLFSRELRRLLAHESSLDALLFDPLIAKLKDRFETLRAEGQTSQTPTFLRIRNFSGDEERWDHDVLTEVDRRHTTFTLTSVEIAELNRLAGTLQPFMSTATVRERYRLSCLIEEPPPPGAEGLECFHACVLDLARRMHGALFTFLELCRPDFVAAKIGGQLQDWEDRVVNRLKIDPVPWRNHAHTPRARPTVASTGDVVQLVVEPVFGSASDKDEYQMRVAVTGGAKKFMQQAESRAHDGDALTRQVPGLFAAALNNLDDLDGVHVEAILPAELLPHGVDKWMWLNGSRSVPICTEYPVALRSYERGYHGDYQHARLRQKSKWKQLGNGFHAGHVAWHDGTAMPNEEIFRSWEDRETLALCALALSFGNSGDRRGGVERLLCAGIPLAVWFRQASAVVAGWREFITDRFVAVSREEWRSRALAFHRNPVSPCSPSCSGLALLWDNPEQALPPAQGWKDAPLMPPSSGHRS